MTYNEPITYGFNFLFTRPDEDNATVYHVGMNVEARDERTARQLLAERNAHLTILDVELVYIVNDDGDFHYRNGRNLDDLTKRLSAFDSFADLVNAKGHYRPTIHLDRDFADALADAYDRVQAARGDDRRAYRRPAPDTVPCRGCSAAPSIRQRAACEFCGGSGVVSRTA